MAVDEPSADIAWVGLIVGTLFAVVCAVLILVGVVGGGVWFTVVAMGILALSRIAARQDPPHTPTGLNVDRALRPGTVRVP